MKLKSLVLSAIAATTFGVTLAQIATEAAAQTAPRSYSYGRVWVAPNAIRRGPAVISPRSPWAYPRGGNPSNSYGRVYVAPWAKPQGSGLGPVDIH